MLMPVEVSDVMMVFPATVTPKYLPPREAIPEEFWRGRTEWNKLVSRWFFSGLEGRFVWKDGIDGLMAIRHLKTLMGSYEPKHEHKEAAVAWLLSLWAERFERA